MTDQPTADRIVGRDHNAPPLPKQIADEQNFGQTVMDYLRDQYAQVPTGVLELNAEFEKIVRPLTGDDAKDTAAALVKRMREERKKAVAFHEAEKANYQSGGRSCDQFFFAAIDALARRDNKANPGMADILGQAITDYDTRILAEKQAAAKRDADRLAAIEQKRLDDLAAAEQAEREAALAAERARKPEHIETKTAIAEQAAVVTDAAKVEAVVAAEAAEAAHIETLRTPANIMRTRGASGTMTTMGTVPFAEIEDREELLKDAAKIWAYLDLASLEKAVRGFARSNDHSQQLAGCKIGKRPKSRVL